MLKRFLRPLLVVRARVRAAWIFQAAFQELLNLAPGEVPSVQLLERLGRGWNNDSFVARPEYLHALATLCAVTDSPILECGSGLTTIICAAVAARRGIEVWTLEHQEVWLERVRRVCSKVPQTTAHLTFAVLRNFGDFDWYDAPLDAMPQRFGLVVCDGPPGTTRGGRVGLLSVMRDRLGKGSIILLDNTHRSSELEAIETWKSMAPMEVTSRSMSDRAFSIITLL